MYVFLIHPFYFLSFPLPYNGNNFSVFLETRKDRTYLNLFAMNMTLDVLPTLFIILHLIPLLFYQDACSSGHYQIIFVLVDVFLTKY